MNAFEKWMTTTTAALAFGAMAVTPAALAQTASSEPEAGKLEEIVVTARKTAENLQEIPVAVTAFSAGNIEKLNIQGLADVARFTPGFSFESYSGAFNAPVLRGQTQTRIDLLVQNTASFFNGVYLQRGYMVDSSLLDIERIEVIKGPQSALYGRNAFSGAINYITRKPGDELEASASLTIGTDERLDYKGSISGPIVPGKLGLLLAAGKSEFDGTWFNTHPLAATGVGTQNNLGGWDKNSVLAAVSITPIDSVSIEIAYSRTDNKVEHLPSYVLSTIGAGSLTNSLNCSPLPNVGATTGVQNRLFCGTIPTLPVIQPGELRNAGILVDPRAFAQDGQSNVLSAKTEWQIAETLSLAYQFGLTDTNVQARGSPSRDALRGGTSISTATGIFTGLLAFDSQPIGGFESQSHEVRLEYTPGGIVRRLMVGAYKSDSFDDAAGRAEYAEPNTRGGPLAYFSLANSTRKDDVRGYFGLATLDLTSALAVTGELRYTEEELTLLTKQTPVGDVCAAALPFAACPPTLRLFSSTPASIDAPVLRRQQDTFDYWTPRIAVDYKLGEGHLLYASVGKGVKSGGQNVPGLDPSQDTYEPEENWTYEVGSKNDFLEGRLRANVAAYWIDWTGIQGSIARNYPASGRTLGNGCFAACTAPAPGLPAAVIVGNLGDATVWGLELDGAWIATDNLLFNYAVSYTNPEYKDGQISQRASTAQNCDGIVCRATTFGANGRPTTGANIGGNSLERTPKLKGSLGAQYDWSLEDPGIAFSLRGDVTYQDKQFVDEMNLASVPSRTLFDASLSASLGRYTARLWGKNLFDEEYVSSSFFLIGTGGARSASYVPFLGEKRTIGLTLSAKY
jgi:iron complex outermembrane receptor protein